MKYLGLKIKYAKCTYTPSRKHVRFVRYLILSVYTQFIEYFYLLLQNFHKFVFKKRNNWFMATKM